jgi:hypothetical protein
MHVNRDMRTGWSVGLTAVFLAIATLAISFAKVDDAGARWAWCLGDPRYTLVTPDGQVGEIWIEAYFPADQLESVTAIDVTLTVPANIAATVDPASLGVFVDGQLVEEITVTGTVASSGEDWRRGQVEVDVEATVHASGDFPVQFKITRLAGDDVREIVRNGRSNEVFYKTDIPVKFQ